MNITKEQTGELTATLKVEVKESDYNADYQQELKIMHVSRLYLALGQEKCRWG